MRRHSRRVRLRGLLPVAALVTGLLALAPVAPAEAQSNGCPSVGTNFSADGPFSVTTQTTSVTTFYSPQNLGSQGCDQHPVIIWGNGTFTSPSWYDGLLRHWASHGFIVAAANTSNAGSGTEMRQGIDQLETWNSQPGHRFNGRVDLDNIGASGHSQGAAGAIRAATDSRVDTTFPIQGNGTPTNVSSALMLAGDGDPFSAQMLAGYNATSAAAAFAELRGSNHLTPLGNAGNYRQVSTAWARWMLMGDADGARQFQGSSCGYCSGTVMARYQANAALQAYSGGSGGGNGGGGDGDGACHTASNSQHRDAGRAEGFLTLTAVGSGDSLGLWLATTSLRETSPGNWSRVDSC